MEIQFQVIETKSYLSQRQMLNFRGYLLVYNQVAPPYAPLVDLDVT